MSKPCENGKISERLGRVGGQAVLEGVMMRSGKDVALAVRKPDGSIALDRSEFVSSRKKHKILDLPLIRGVVNFVEMMILSYNTIMKSADLTGIEEELAAGNGEKEFTPEEEEKRKKKARKIVVVTEVIAVILGLLLAVGLFVVLPVYAAKLLNYLTPGDMDSLFAVTSLVEGIVRIVIFILYLYLCSLMPDMRRTFEYHGAEHKSVFCYEYGWDLTPANAAKCTRFHPRCGTSFLFVMLLISIVIGAFIPGSLPRIVRVGVKLLLLPLTVGLGYEFIYFAGRHDNWLVRALSAPGLWMQKITTREPDESQLEVALAALKAAIPAEFPEMEGIEEIPAASAASDEAAEEAAPETADDTQAD